jgi:PAS domain S-box-containing protein
MLQCDARRTDVQFHLRTSTGRSQKEREMITRSWSIQRLFSLFLLAALLPQLLLGAYGIYTEFATETERAEDNLNVLAQLTAAHTRQFINDTEQLLTRLAERDAIRAVSSTHCDPILAEFHAIAPQFANIGVINSAGQVICSAVPQPGGKPASVAATGWFQTAFQRGTFVVGEPFVGPITHKWVSVLAYPLRDRRQQVVGVLALPIDLVRYQTLLNEVTLPADALITIVDEHDRVIARSHDPEQWVGRLAPSTEITALASHPPAIAIVAPENSSHITAVAAIPDTPWRVAASMPSHIAYADVRAILLRIAILNVGTLVVMSILIVLLSRFIASPIRALAQATAAAERDQLDTRLPLDGPREVVAVAARFNAMLIRRSQVETELRQAEERFAQAFHASPIGIGIASMAGGYYIDANEQFLALLGYTRHDLASAHMQLRRIWVDPNLWTTIETAFRAGRVVRDLETSIRTHTGELRLVVVAAEQITLTGIACVLVLIQDITDRHQLKTQLAQAQKLESIGRLAGGIAHDFNNLLTAIMGYATLVADALPLQHEARSDLQEIHKAGGRAARLTRHLLAFARKQAIDPQVINLNTLILDVDTLLRRLIGADVELITLPAADVLWVKADADQLEQVLINLVVNARDAMPDGGKITIETAYEYIRHGASATGTLQPGRYARLTVRDTGSGIPESVRPYLFEPFFTTKGPGHGTGLGLATCYGIVTQHRGTIAFASIVGEETIFTVYLPSTDEAPTLPEPIEPLVGISHGPATVLLVEDEDAVRAFAVRILQNLGYTVIAAANGVDALAYLQMDDRPTIDVFLTDMVMPMMGGRVLAEQVKALLPEITIVYMSGYADRADTLGGNRGLSDMLLHKPFTAETLARMMQTVLSAHASLHSS